MYRGFKSDLEFLKKVKKEVISDLYVGMEITPFRQCQKYAFDNLGERVIKEFEEGYITKREAFLELITLLESAREKENLF